MNFVKEWKHSDRSVFADLHSGLHFLNESHRMDPPGWMLTNKFFPKRMAKNLQEQFKTEMEAMVAEHESAKAEHRVRQELFERQIRDLEESCTRRVELLSSKSNIIEYVQKIDNAAVEHSDYLQHSENLKTLVADPKTDISHLVALQVCSLLTSTIWHLSFPIDLDCPNLFKPNTVHA